MSRIEVDKVVPQTGTDLTIGESGDVLKTEGQFQMSPPIMHLQHQEASGVAGATLTSGAWDTRTINTVIINEITGASLSSNQITLPAGTYTLNAQLEFYLDGNVSKFQTRLRNISDSITEILGQGHRKIFNSGGADESNRFNVRKKLTVVSTKTFELQYFSTTSTPSSEGQPSSTGEGEMYADVWIEKIG